MTIPVRFRSGIGWEFMLRKAPIGTASQLFFVKGIASPMESVDRITANAPLWHVTSIESEIKGKRQ